MTKTISKIQKIASKNDQITLNASLPISIKVLERIDYARYMLEFRNKKLNTKSFKSLKVGAKYWCEIESGKENIIIQNLYEKPNFKEIALSEGLSLIEKIITNGDFEWFYEHIQKNLAEQSQKEIFEIYTDMLFAIAEQIVHIPFVYGQNFGVFQMKFKAQISEIYLVFSNFAPLLFKFENSKISSISTPFKKVARLLEDEFGCEILVRNFNEIYTPKTNIIDFKG